MSSLTEVHLQNYRSFLDARCRLSPVTAVIGANNAGKSNLLKGLRDVIVAASDSMFTLGYTLGNSHHRKYGSEATPRTLLVRAQEEELAIRLGDTNDDLEPGWKYLPLRDDALRWRGELSVRKGGYYILDADKIGNSEPDQEDPFVHSDGEGVTRVLQMLSLKQRKAFQLIEEEFRRFVPEIEELTFERADQGKWFLQVRETGLEDTPVALSEMSEGTRTILALLTIIHQPNRPELILLEDIEHAIHPRGLAPLVETMRRMAEEHGVQFIFTTQSPYVLDCFQKPEYWDDVVIVEKKDGVSTLTNAKDRLVALGYEREMENLPLGDLWYSGALGGVAGPNELWDEPESKP